MISAADVLKPLYGYHCNMTFDSEILSNFKRNYCKEAGLFMLTSKYLHKNFWKEVCTPTFTCTDRLDRIISCLYKLVIYFGCKMSKITYFTTWKFPNKLKLKTSHVFKFHNTRKLLINKLQAWLWSILLLMAMVHCFLVKGKYSFILASVFVF
jgi:hypothetical protein